ncbi:MAG TPA: flagellar basal-body MS-ring/collar protein FliF [Alphaproteobacteria bacterium]
MQGLLNLMSKIGPLRLALMGAVTLGMVLFFVFVMARLSNSDMKLLYADLSPQDQNAIVRELEAATIPYMVNDTRQEIKVPATEVGRARMLLAEKGLPDGGSIGYEIFDKDSGLTSTRFDQDIRQLRALEGELTRTVTTIKAIEASRIHLVLPKRELFSQEERPASASVFLKLRAGGRLDNEQVSSIQHLIAAAVPNLDPRHVSIVDQNGNLLASGRQDSEGETTNANLEQMRMAYEQRMTLAIEDIVGRVVGVGKVRAHVTADINYDRESTSAEIYDPEGQVARSTQTVEEKDREADGSGGAQNVSVQNNLPGLGAGGSDSNAKRDSSRTEEITNFEVSKTVKNHTREGGEVKRLSVAVLVDGTYSKDKKGEQVYNARNQQQLDTIKTLVSSAIGFDTKRGDTLEIKNLQFANMDEIFNEQSSTGIVMGLDKDDLFRISETAVMGLVALLVVLLVLRPLANKLLAAPLGGSGGLGTLGSDNIGLLGGEMRAALTGPSNNVGTLGDDDMIDIASVDGKMKASAVAKVTEIIDRYPSETVSIVRSWMMQET